MKNNELIVKKSNTREWVESILVAFVIAMVVRTFIIQPFKIPTQSMETTLHGDPKTGDRIFVSKFDYLLKSLVRGDIVVFRTVNIPGLDGTKDYVKRLVGLPGDIIEIKDGNLHVNNVLVEYPAIIKDTYYLNHGAFAREDKSITVPENKYFVLGDNSLVSKDSRYWGFVPKENIIGTVSMIYWPISRFNMFKHPQPREY